MKIQELERIVGCDRATIRYYEREGLITPKRAENGYRDYSDENAEELKKIRLLRQLGLSVWKIRCLQQGSAGFSEVLSEQIETLTAQIAEHKRSRAVCEALRNDGAQYETLDTDRYLKLLQEMRQNDRTTVDFKESVPREIHPWRRYFARTFDYALLNAVVQFVIIVLLRIRPVPEGLLNTLLTIATAAAFVPIEALMLSAWGTTPGKLIFGIHIESANGGKLSRQAALERAWLVYREGVFCAIPFLGQYLMARNYCILTGRSLRPFTHYSEVSQPEEMLWDSNTEISYASRWDKKRAVALAVAGVVFLTLASISASDSYRPKHRGNELTMEQFSANYNYYLDFFNENVADHAKLNPDGSRKPIPYNTVVISTSGEQVTELDEFEYDTENGILRAVSMSQHYENVFYVTPLDDYEFVNLAYTLLLSQDDCGLKEINEFAKLLEKNSIKSEAHFAYKNLQISWSILHENCNITHDGGYWSKQEDNASLDFWFEIRVNNPY